MANIRRLIYGLALIIAALIQNSVAFLPRLLNVKAVLLLPLVIGVAMQEFEIPALFFGLLAGLLADIFSAAPGGFNALLFTSFAFLVSALINTVMRNNIVTALLFNGLGLLIYFPTHWLFTVVLKAREGALAVFLTFHLPSALYTLLFFPMFYYFAGAVKRRTHIRAL